MSEDVPKFLLEDPAISPDGNISFRICVETNAANTNITGAQNLLVKENDSDVNINPRLPETGNQPDNRGSITTRNIETPTGACLAGNHTMQHLVRRPSRFDYLSSSCGSDALTIDNGFYTSGTPFHSESSTGSNSFGTDGSPSNPRLPISPFEGRQQQNHLRNSNRNTYERFLQKYGHTVIIDTNGHQSSEFQEPKGVFRGGSNGENSPIEDPYPGCANPLSIISNTPCTNSQNFLNLAAGQPSTTANDFASYPPAPITSSRTGQDQVLDQNLVSAAKYVYELTDGSSRPTSRASSSSRVPEGSNSSGVGANYTHFNEIEKAKKGVLEISGNGTGMPTVTTSSAAGIIDNLTDGNPTQRAAVGSNSTQQISEDSRPEQLPFNGPEPPQSVGSAVLDDISLAAQLSQLALNYSGRNDLNSSQLINIILNLMASNPTNASSSTRPISTPNEIPQSINDWGPFSSNPRACRGPSVTSANDILSDQLSSLLISLGKINPALLSALLACVESGQIDAQQILVKLLTNKLNMPNNGLSNLSLLSSIGSLLSTEAVRNNSELMDTLTSQLTAYAARFDSGKALQSNGYHYPPMAHSRQHIRQSPNFGNEPPFSSVYYRMHMNDSALSVGQCCNRQGTLEGDIDRAATIYRNSANNASQKLETIHRWSGKLPMRNYNSMCFSRKVFLGGVPWDSTSDDLINTFSQFGNVSVLWPQKDGGYISHHHNNDVAIDRSMSVAPKGYCYLLFEHESCVAELLAKCTRDASNGGEYFKLSSPKFKSKSVQVIPWVISDSQFSCGGGQSSLQISYTVFVGALHGMITAEALASIMNELFGNVTFAALDTDKHKYPIGSGRVVFRNHASYMRAVTANFVEVRTPKFTKTIQIDPFLEDSLCDTCHLLPGVYFCRSLDCFQYFCPTCWQKWHSANQTNHKPLRRSLKLNTERA
ncbi:cytoplasmic polyadenylation element binding [Echinococcus multilocularis]|uniref:Cytoplasmic polyadenylation element binding n=1 Tax=Echinococcus multilocularis TaxID=6211 RepID=A0A068YGE2_ECHMU|nr:cytoplasmic polyadenylation element binding [Echinococcus multilocularis]